ncbi:hypothetical protein AB205_0108270 [Aquarana catesbeiana]|uniref:Uncharacterized protein n=2 Tax=Aquarana catesbeiana TaxID=8400 RepID=A0A2G9QNI5_AQUCT|nr:hypothetical protein AB205_0108270 [Aquarana catesbeiana]
MELSRDLIESYPGHEALWCHRRQILGLIHQLHNEQSSSSTVQATDVDGAVIGPGNGTHNYTSFLSYPTNTMDIDGACDTNKQGYTQETKRLKRTPVQDSLIFESELRFITCVLTGCRNAEQCRFAASYRKWLLSIVGH